MRIAISNLAWDITEDEAVAALLQRYQVNAIDIAPSKYFAQPALATDSQMASVKAWWRQHGIDIVGMQALLFGTLGLNIFAAPDIQAAMLGHLGAICRIGSALGATRLVFGSPKNRDRRGLSDADALAVAVPFFRQLGNVAAAHGVVVCLEPNPACYGTNFMTHSQDTAQVVTQIDHPAIRMQLDTGAMTVNAEDPCAVLSLHAGLIGHVHASEPELRPLGDGGQNGDGGTDHAAMFGALHSYLPDHVVTIEMLATAHEPHLVSIERALQVAIQYYRDDRDDQKCFQSNSTLCPSIL